jgi:hypothetical protein
MNETILLVYRPRSDWHGRWDLTPEKVYNCWWEKKMLYSSDDVYYTMINDVGEKIEVHESHLVLLSKVREEKLDKLV